MARRYEIDDAQWEKIKPFLGNTPKKTGRPQADNRNLLNGVLWIMHTGAPWRDPPGYYGPWQTVYKRFSQWEKDEKLKQLYLHSLRRCPFLGMHRKRAEVSVQLQQPRSADRVHGAGCQRERLHRPFPELLLV